MTDMADANPLADEDFYSLLLARKVGLPDWATGEKPKPISPPPQGFTIGQPTDGERPVKKRSSLERHKPQNTGEIVTEAGNQLKVFDPMQGPQGFAFTSPAVPPSLCSPEAAASPSGQISVPVRILQNKVAKVEDGISGLKRDSAVSNIEVTCAIPPGGKNVAGRDHLRHHSGTDGGTG